MDVLTALMVFSALAAAICTRARAVGPAVFFSVLATALLAVSPLGAFLDALREAFNTTTGSGGGRVEAGS